MDALVSSSLLITAKFVVGTRAHIDFSKLKDHSLKEQHPDEKFHGISQMHAQAMKNNLSTQLIKKNSYRSKELPLVYAKWQEQSEILLNKGVSLDKIDSELTRRYSDFVKRACLRSFARELAFGDWLKCNAADGINLFNISGLSTFFTKFGIGITGLDENFHNFKFKNLD